MPTNFSAIRIAISSPSMAQGPASIKKFPLSKCLMLGILCKFIVFEIFCKYNTYSSEIDWF